ncbi:MAG: 1-acyl-sn-glycerol-3-phosphate acyltransferase [Ruminococcus sp.]|nr:1-acyl-sn-glycerol-3-phosphate acyltransferase [Ruminococcus sp.]
MRRYLKNVWNAIFIGIMHGIFFLFGIGVRLIYRGRIVYTDPAAKAAMQHGAILIANHKSHKDGFFVPQMLWRKKVYVLVTSKWYNKKLLHPMFTHLRYIPIDLQQVDSSWIVQTEAALKKGACVLIFPEGKLETNGVPEVFRAGFLLPAKHQHVPVVPMGIVGDYRPFHKQMLVVGVPLSPDFHGKDRQSAILERESERCKEQVFALTEWKDTQKR